MDVIKNDFMMQLRAKLKEEQMIWINNSGIH